MASKKKLPPPKSPKPPEPEEPEGTLKPRPCPLGCGHVFRYGVNGWHHHIGPWARHPHWHPEERDPEVRKALFLDEFPDFLPKRGRETREKRQERIEATRAQRMGMSVPGVLIPRPQAKPPKPSGKKSLIEPASSPYVVPAPRLSALSIEEFAERLRADRPGVVREIRAEIGKLQAMLSLAEASSGEPATIRREDR